MLGVNTWILTGQGDVKTINITEPPKVPLGVHDANGLSSAALKFLASPDFRVDAPIPHHQIEVAEFSKLRFYGREGGAYTMPFRRRKETSKTPIKALADFFDARVSDIEGMHEENFSRLYKGYLLVDAFLAIYSKDDDKSEMAQTMINTAKLEAAARVRTLGDTLMKELTSPDYPDLKETEFIHFLDIGSTTDMDYKPQRDMGILSTLLARRTHLQTAQYLRDELYLVSGKEETWDMDGKPITEMVNLLKSPTSQWTEEEAKSWLFNTNLQWNHFWCLPSEGGGSAGGGEIMHMLNYFVRTREDVLKRVKSGTLEDVSKTLAGVKTRASKEAYNIKYYLRQYLLTQYLKDTVPDVVGLLTDQVKLIAFSTQGGQTPVWKQAERVQERVQLVHGVLYTYIRYLARGQPQTAYEFFTGLFPDEPCGGEWANWTVWCRQWALDGRRQYATEVERQNYDMLVCISLAAAFGRHRRPTLSAIQVDEILTRLILVIDVVIRHTGVDASIVVPKTRSNSI